MADLRLNKTLTAFGLYLGLLLLCLQSSFAAQRWQLVILADNSVTDNTPALPPEWALYTDINGTIEQALTRVLNTADFDIHKAQALGLEDCQFATCNAISVQNIRAAAQRANQDIQLALLHRISAFQQRQNASVSWQFNLAGRIVDLASGLQLDAFEVTKLLDEPPKNCIAECKNNWLSQQLNFMSQELGTVLAEKLRALPRRQHYDLQIHNFTRQELQQTVDYLQNLDSYVAATLRREYAVRQQWLHQVASRDYQYVTTLSSNELGSRLAHFMDEQGMQVNITYEQKQSLFILSRSGMPYLSRYIALVTLLVLAVAYLAYRKKPPQATPTKTRKVSLLWLLALWLVFATGLYWHYRQGTFLPFMHSYLPAPENPLKPPQAQQTPEQEQLAKQQLQDNNDWQQATKLNTLQSYQMYVNRWPDGQYLLQASAALKVKTDDEAAWQAALKLATAEAYQDYLDNQPAGDFRQRALQKLALLFKHSQQNQKLQDLIQLAEVYYYQQKNYGEARYYYQQAAQMDDALAQYQLAQIYALGQGTTVDQRLATKWYQQAAEQGHAQAQFEVAYRHSKGLGTRQDHGQAMYWYQQAAGQGITVAQYNLAYIYAMGQVTQRDYQQAAYWYQQAAAQGDADAQNNLGKLYENGQGVSQDLTTARNLYRRAAAQGHQVAKINLSLLQH